ncbi:MAG: hypothetical protein GEU99_10515 [Luteitalea sp.]|nr:hypothetical protein [Luteitalea sp.]
MRFQPLSGDLDGPNVAKSAILVWKLSRVRLVECQLKRITQGVELDVIRAGKTLGREHWSDVHAALERAWDIRRELLSLGWTDTQTLA